MYITKFSFFRSRNCICKFEISLEFPVDAKLMGRYYVLPCIDVIYFQCFL